MNLTPIKNNIVFEFIDRVNAKGEFEKEKSESGLVLTSSFDDSAKEPRWINVVAVGPDCTSIRPGQQALLPNLRWTSGFKFGGVRMWKSDETQVVALRDAPASQIQPLENVVLFRRNAKTELKSPSGLIVVGGNDETPSGVVLHVGPDVSAELQSGATIYFDDTNFTDTFKHAGVVMSFIKDDSILAYQ